MCNLITPTKSSFPDNVAYSQDPRMGTWTMLGWSSTGDDSAYHTDFPLHPDRKTRIISSQIEQSVKLRYKISNTWENANNVLDSQ